MIRDTSVCQIDTLANFRGTNVFPSYGASVVFLQGTTSPQDGGQGFYQVNLTDKASADNGSTVIVDAGGYRWNSFAGPFSALAGSISVPQMGNTTYTIGLVGFVKSGVDFNAANTDNAIAITLPTGFTRWRANLCLISHASASLTTATCGLFTVPAAGGVAIVSSGTAITVSTAAENTSNNSQSLATASALFSFNVTTVYFRVQNAQGSAATADVLFTYVPLP